MQLLLWFTKFNFQAINHNQFSNYLMHRKKKKKSKKEASEKVVEQITSGPSVSEPSSSSKPIAKTEAELNLERIRKERLDKKIANLAEKSHKDRVEEFNTYLSKLSEHHDIPRVGPG